MLEMQPRYLAVERNFELVPRTRHAHCVLKDGDQLEIVTLVGGG
jgi:thiamine biosynthesis protein ThiS